jgi:formate-dependent phosphoribosylglycinamide formyltransferase (GAR transformylase)
VDVPDPLPLRNIAVPLEVSQVAGCDCGGLELHRAAASWSLLPPCSIWELPPDQAQAAVAEAQARLAWFGAELNRRLRVALGYPASGSGSP